MGQRILVVEDDLLNRMYYCEVLKRGGFEVAEVDDGARVMERARAVKPDLVIMDINLPNVSGIELIEQLRREPSFSGLPVLAITAYVGKIEERRIREAGASDFLAKPVTIERLTTTIESLLAAH